MREFRILTSLIAGLVIGSAQEPSPVYAGTDRGVYRSLDGGTRWERLRGEIAVPGAMSLAVSPFDRSLIYAGTVKGLLRSIDGGQTWSTAGPNEQPVWGVLVDPSSASRVYAQAQNGLWTSVDSGSHWVQSLASSPPYPVWLALDATDASTLYATSRGGVLKSVDSGQNWSRTSATADAWFVAAGSEAGRLYRAGVGGL
jgi:photosystem II stability/assembly factor-like uncharacterized protein